MTGASPIVPPPLPVAMPAEPTLGKRLRCLAAIVTIFVVFGPPVGALTFMLSIAVIGMGSNVDLIGLSWIGLFALIYAAPLSYFLGAGPAAAGGLIFGVRQAFFGPVIWPVAALIGVGLGIGFLVMSGHSLPSMLTVTPLGTGTGILPIRDIAQASPTRRGRAARPRCEPGVPGRRT